MRIKSTFLTLVILLLFAGKVVSQDYQTIPELKARVTDVTGTLSGSEISSLEAKIKAFEDTAGSQIVVLIIPTTKPEEIEQYSIRVAEQWKIGRKKIDDGVILIIAKNDRKLRIEVGYGLEGAIPDAYSKRIIDQIIVPEFRNGDFYLGVSKGVDALINLINGEELPGADNYENPEYKKHPVNKYWKILMVLFPIFLVVGAIISTIFKKNKVVKIIYLIVVFAIVFFLTSSFIISTIYSIIMLIFSSAKSGGGGSGRSRGGWYVGGSGGSFGGGGGFSGGGFSGGGGSFGGGGASGGW